MSPGAGQPGEPEWVTRDGERIALSRLSDLHLGNCIAMMRRRYDEHKDDYLAALRWGGDLAEQASAEAEHRSARQCATVMVLEREMLRRHPDYAIDLRLRGLRLLEPTALEATVLMRAA